MDFNFGAKIGPKLNGKKKHMSQKNQQTFEYLLELEQNESS